MKIYTRTGDEGETGLLGGHRVSKSAVRLHAYGSVDELNAVLGLALALGLAAELVEAVGRVQDDLFVVGADLAAPMEVQTKWVIRVSPDMISRLEHEIDGWDAQLPVLKHFILPGGTPGAACLHQARTVCRRAERWVVALQGIEAVNPDARRYLNRLSDWLFVAARWANQAAGGGERVWQSPNRQEGV